jgi:hypothetical protein
MMSDIAELERRVAALEAAHNDTVKSQRWMASTLGRIAAVQDEHTERLDRIEGHIKSMRSEISALPSALAEIMREVMKEGKA